MILLNVPSVVSQEVLWVDRECDITQTPTGSLLIYPFERESLPFFREVVSHKIHLGVSVSSLVEIVLVASVNPLYCIVPPFLAKQAQALATNYLWDMKIIALISREAEIAWAANLELDGVILR